MIITGTITQVGQASEPSGQYAVRYQDITITDPNGKEWYGRIGSKQGYQENTPISVTVEVKQGEQGEYNYFRKHNPQYADQTSSQRSPQAPSQAAESSKKENVDWEDLRMARMSSLNNATRLICLLAEMNKDATFCSTDTIKATAAEMVDYIYNGVDSHKKEDGSPNF